MSQQSNNILPVRKKKAVYLRVAIGFLLTAAFLWFVVSQIDIRKFGITLLEADLRLVLASAACIPFLVLFRSLRLAAVLGIPVSPKLLQLVVLHSFAASIAPFRLGDAALPVLLRARKDTSLLGGVGTLVLIRVLDLLFLVLLGGLATFQVDFGSTLDTKYDWMRWVGAVGAISSLGILILLQAVGGLGPAFASCLPQGRFAARIKELMTAYRILRPWRTFFKVCLFSIVIQILGYMIFHFFALATHIMPGFFATAFATTAMTFAFALPVNGVGSIGAAQAAWAFCLSLVGVSFSNALATAIATQIMVTLIWCALVASGMLVYSVRKHR